LAVLPVFVRFALLGGKALGNHGQERRKDAICWIRSTAHWEAEQLERERVNRPTTEAADLGLI